MSSMRALAPDACAEVSPPRSPRYESLTLWRGLACLLVVCYHSNFTGDGARVIPNGTGLVFDLFGLMGRFWLGVPLFFVISGYCIIASADALRRRGKTGRDFFWRRFRRIYPPYWTWFAVAAVLVWSVEKFLQPGFFQSAYIPNPRDLTGWQWLGNLSLTETWRWHVTGGTENKFLAHAWTLCYEEQFYAIVGLVLLFAGRFFFRSFAVITLLVGAGIFLFPIYNLSTDGLFLDGQWLLFAAGILVYFVLNHAPVRWAGWFCAPLWLGIIWAFADPRHLFETKFLEPNQNYFVAFAFALLLVGLRRWDDALSRARILWPFRICGEMCYSLYLVHWPVVMAVGRTCDLLGLKQPATILFVSIPCSVAAAILVGRIFHVTIERRFLNRSPLSPQLTNQASASL